MDTSVLLDLFLADPHFLERSRFALRRCAAEGALVACEVVWAEVAAFFASAEAAREQLDAIGIGFGPLGTAAALRAGGSWGEYRRRGGARARVIPDFLIGAHALVEADRLLTRDRGFYRTYFSELQILDPTRARSGN